jgi:hypothetical protein
MVPSNKLLPKLGLLCLIYGSFVLLLILIPNAMTGRLCFVFCGGAIFTIGAILYSISRRMRAHLLLHPEETPVDPEQSMPHFAVEPGAKSTDSDINC